MSKNPLAFVLLENNLTRFAHIQNAQPAGSTQSSKPLLAVAKRSCPRKNTTFFRAKFPWMPSRHPEIIYGFCWPERLSLYFKTPYFFPLIFPNSFWTQYSMEGLPSKNSHSQIPYYKKAYSLPWIYYCPTLCHVLLFWYGRRVTPVIPQDPSSH